MLCAYRLLAFSEADMKSNTTILAVSDMHGNLESVHELIRMHRPDVLICCGDWGDPGTVSRSEYESIIEQTHVLTVFGNHDDLDLLKELRNQDGSPILIENNVIREVAGIRIAGWSGIWAKSHAKPWYITDEEVRSIGRKLSGQVVHILVTHGCAIGLCDSLASGKRGGHRSFLDAVKIIKPEVYLCGHLHVQQFRTTKDGISCANIGSTAEGDYVLLFRLMKDWDIKLGRLLPQSGS